MSKNNTVTFEQELEYADNLSAEMREKIASDLLSFVNTDVLFFRAEYPENLLKRQNEKWNPVLDWFGKEYGVRPNITTRLTPPKQIEKLTKVIVGEVQKMNGRELVAFAKMAGAFTSLILALAVMKKYLALEDAFALSRLDELFQNEMWGEDKEAKDSRNVALADAKNAWRFING